MDHRWHRLWHAQNIWAVRDINNDRTSQLVVPDTLCTDQQCSKRYHLHWLWTNPFNHDMIMDGSTRHTNAIYQCKVAKRSKWWVKFYARCNYYQSQYSCLDEIYINNIHCMYKEKKIFEFYTFFILGGPPIRLH